MLVFDCRICVATFVSISLRAGVFNSMLIGSSKCVTFRSESYCERYLILPSYFMMDGIGLLAFRTGGFNGNKPLISDSNLRCLFLI